MDQAAARKSPCKLPCSRFGSKGVQARGAGPGARQRPQRRHLRILSQRQSAATTDQPDWSTSIMYRTRFLGYMFALRGLA